MARNWSVLLVTLVALQLHVSVPGTVADHAGHAEHTTTAVADDAAADPTDDAADDHSGHTMTSTDAASPMASMSGDMPACATDPSAADCASYVYPDVRSIQDIETNCEAMPFMVACSVWQACQDGNMEGEICEPFNVLASTCQDEGMSGMPGCPVYTPMCLTTSESVVEQCNGAGISRLVSTMPTQMQIIENCGTHSMPGCEDCTAEGAACANTLETLQSVCNAHSMEMCTGYNTMCSVNGDSMSHFCGTRGGTFDPPMRMYFHNGIRDIILFRKFVPENNGEYAGAIILFIVVGVIASALRVYRSVTEADERIQRNKVVRANTGVVAEQSVFSMPIEEIMPRAAHGVLSFIIITLDYALMLAAMTFNVGIFFAVVAGLTLGMLLFRHMGSRAMERMQARSLLETPACGCKPTTVGFEAIAMGTCCDVSKHAHARDNSSEGKAGSGNIAAAGRCASRQSVGDPDLLAPETGEPACCGS